MKDAGPDHCGCCGREIGRARMVHEWCEDCEKHVLPWTYGRGPWDRTYYAQHKKPCPFDVDGRGGRTEATA